MMKRNRKIISLDKKIVLLDYLAAGEKIASVARKFKVNESTVRTIKKSEVAIRSSVACGSSVSNRKTCHSRSQTLERVERELAGWLQQQRRNGTTLRAGAIRQVAVQLFEDFKTKDKNISFQASKGWFEKFKKRYNIRLSGDLKADPEPTEAYRAELRQYIERRGYQPQQVFNADETKLYWKRMPARTTISRKEKVAPGFKASKDKVSLLFCCNASGCHMVKPMLVYRSFGPRALKNKDKNCLPVFWRAESKAQITTDLFMDWFVNCFVPSVRQYLISKLLPFKALLLIDNAPAHLETLTLIHPNIEVLFLPSDLTSSRLQPLEQGIPTAFKRYYHRRLFDYVLRSIQMDPLLSVAQCWKQFNIAQGIVMIREAVDEFRASTLNASWIQLWPEIVIDDSDVPDKIAEIEDILEILHQIPEDGFGELQSHDVGELLDSHEIDTPDTEQSEHDPLEPTPEAPRPPAAITISHIKKIISIAQQLQDFVFDIDPSLERSLKFKSVLVSLLEPYKEMLKQLKEKKTLERIEQKEHTRRSVKYKNYT